jgi:hypothetical protein
LDTLRDFSKSFTRTALGKIIKMNKINKFFLRGVRSWEVPMLGSCHIEDFGIRAAMGVRS